MDSHYEFSRRHVVLGLAITALPACVRGPTQRIDGALWRGSDARQEVGRSDNRVRQVVNGVIGPLMRQYGIPGMAIGLVTRNTRHMFDVGLASKELGTPVDDQTLFEIGSISKTFTATLAAYAQARGNLSLTDAASRHLPTLRGSALDRVSLLNLATHTSGGMPLQFPDAVTDAAHSMAYFRKWTPTYPPGSYRTYANPSVGLLGVITAAAMRGEFVPLISKTLLQAIGLPNTYLEVPNSKRPDYAQGYTRDDQAVRMSPGVLSAPAYGVRSTARDMVRFVEANLNQSDLDSDVGGAIRETHTGHYRLGAMTQDLIWEQYPFPVELDDLLTGNSPAASFNPNPVTAILPAQAPRSDVWINKTGSTNGFGAYVAFVPARRSGIVLLANKNYPIDARVTAAYRILSALG